MKTLKNETTEIPFRDRKMTFADIIRQCLDHAPANGFSFADIRERSRIEKVLDDMGDDGDIMLEDADATNLKKIVDLMKWGIRHDDIIAFADAIEELVKKSGKKSKKPNKKSDKDE